MSMTQTHGGGYKMVAPVVPGEKEMSSYLYACAEGLDDSVRLFLDKWPDQTGVHWKDNGRTGLHIALLNGHQSTVELLIERKAQLYATDKSGVNALMLAAESGNETLVGMMLEKGFRASTKDNDGRSALHHYVFGGDNDRESGIPALLHRHGAQIDDASPAGVKPLQWALSLGRKMIFRALLDLGADISDPMLQGFASQMETPDFAEMLRDEPARRGREMEEAVSNGVTGTLKVRKPFNLSKEPRKQEPPAQPAARAPQPRSPAWPKADSPGYVRSWTA